VSRVVLITGASSGIGAATARLLARAPGTSLVLVARRAERLQALADELAAPATICAVDLTHADAPATVRAHVEREHGRLDVLVNNAGASRRAAFAEGGHANIAQALALNFEAPVRLTEALLPLLRASAPGTTIVNVSSVTGRIARRGTGAYAASKFALNGWSEALWAEEAAHGVHVGLVLPGFVGTEGFPQAELKSSRKTRWLVTAPETIAEAIEDVIEHAKPERYAPRYYWIAVAARAVAPGLVRAVTGGSASKHLDTNTQRD
jgi:short-subunit dehydrogenase